jgi:hypothetical protein
MARKGKGKEAKLSYNGNLLVESRSLANVSREMPDCIFYDLQFQRFESVSKQVCFEGRHVVASSMDERARKSASVLFLAP